MEKVIFEMFATVLATISALLPIANPLMTVAILPGMAAHLSDAEREVQVKRACIYMAGILVTFLLAGALIMDFFSISIPGLRIAGGLIVSYFGFDMLFAEPGEHDVAPDDKGSGKGKRDISFTPLAMPSLSGPGSIAVVISMSTGVHTQTALPVWLGYITVVCGILLVAYISWLTLRASGKLYRFLGEDGINAISRIMGFLLICIGVQFVINGIGNLLHDPAFWPLAR
ncbi:MarC family NAAT transporter [Chitinibacter sp. GC72]|uniref:MarC family NAAT transporter n=1 Tax=Chitinibacter sp. GC72 TaxID=1526917 RepID=UPI0018DEF8F8|nr:MarC family NAAT transporter [Chitinibacter sp. GC72]